MEATSNISKKKYYKGFRKILWSSLSQGLLSATLYWGHLSWVLNPLLQQLRPGDGLSGQELWWGGETLGKEHRGRLVSVLWHYLGRLWPCPSWATPGTAVSSAKCLPLPPLCAGSSYASDLRSLTMLMWHFVGAVGLLRSWRGTGKGWKTLFILILVILGAVGRGITWIEDQRREEE